MRAAALLTALMLFSAGCIGIGSDDEVDDAGDAPNPDPADTNATGSSAAASGTNSSHGHEPAPEPHFENRTGQVSGTNVLVATQGSPSSESIEIPQTAREIRITLTAEGGEIDGEIFPPSCEEDDDNQQGSDCSEDLSTCEGTSCSMADGGTVEFSATNPDGGTWNVDMLKADPGQSSVDYTLTFFYVDVHEPAPGHHG